jgi:hypothetical protein
MRRSLLGLAALALMGATLALLLFGSHGSRARPTTTKTTAAAQTTTTSTVAPLALAAYRTCRSRSGGVRATGTSSIRTGPQT